MTDVERLLERQARWQRARQTMSWPEKIRLAEGMRSSIEALRRHPVRQYAEPASPARPTDTQRTERG
jgi:hypothetical protein